MTYAFVLFIFAGLAEIGGGYLIWLWLREGLAILLEYFRRNSLVIALFQTFLSFGRVYAAY